MTKISMSDVERIRPIEYKPIPEESVLAPAPLSFKNLKTPGDYLPPDKRKDAYVTALGETWGKLGYKEVPAQY
jgi:hypothetical protein